MDAYLGDQSSSEAPESLSQRHAALWTSRRRSEREERERARQERHIVAILARAWALPDAYYADLNLPVWLDAAPYVMRKTGSVRESVGLVGKPDGARPGETLGGGGVDHVADPGRPNDAAPRCPPRHAPADPLPRRARRRRGGAGRQWPEPPAHRRVAGQRRRRQDVDHGYDVGPGARDNEDRADAAVGRVARRVRGRSHFQPGS